MSKTYRIELDNGKTRTCTDEKVMDDLLFKLQSGEDLHVVKIFEISDAGEKEIWNNEDGFIVEVEDDYEEIDDDPRLQEEVEYFIDTLCSGGDLEELKIDLFDDYAPSAKEWVKYVKDTGDSAKKEGVPLPGMFDGWVQELVENYCDSEHCHYSPKGMLDGIRENSEATEWLEDEWISLCSTLIDTLPGYPSPDDDDSVGTVDPHEFAEHFVDHMVDGVLAGRVLELFHEYEPTSAEWTLFVEKNPDWERGIYITGMPNGFEEWVDELADYFAEQTSSSFTKDEIVKMVLGDGDTRKFMERAWVTLCEEWCEVMEAPQWED